MCKSERHDGDSDMHAMYVTHVASDIMLTSRNLRAHFLVPKCGSCRGNALLKYMGVFMTLVVHMMFEYGHC